MQLFPCCCSHSISLLRTQASCYVTLLLSIIITQCSRCDADPVRSAQTGRRWRGSDFGDTFKWPVLSLATLKGMKLAFRRTARSLRFRGKLTGTKTNLRLRLCSNYTWHVNSREGKQSRKLAAKEDRGEDQEWHGMSLNLTLSSILPCSPCLPMAAALLPTPMVLFFSFFFSFFLFFILTGYSSARSCRLALPFFLSVLLSLFQTPVFEDFVRLPLHSPMEKKKLWIHPSSSTLADFVRRRSNRKLTLMTASFWVRAQMKLICQFWITLRLSFCPLRCCAPPHVEALVTCRQRAKLKWIHLKLLQTCSAQANFKWNTNSSTIPWVWPLPYNQFVLSHEVFSAFFHKGP